MQVLAGMSVNIKYTVALFSALDVLVRKKPMRHARFSLHFARNRMTPCVANVHGNHYTCTSTYLILSLLSDRLIFCNSLSLRGWYLRKKNEYVSQYTIENCSACVNVHNSRTISWYRGRKVNVWSVINYDLSHLGGYIYSIGLVKAVSEPLQELVRASNSSMVVTVNNV